MGARHRRLLGLLAKLHEVDRFSFLDLSPSVSHGFPPSDLYDGIHLAQQAPRGRGPGAQDVSGRAVSGPLRGVAAGAFVALVSVVLAACGSASSPTTPRTGSRRRPSWRCLSCRATGRPMRRTPPSTVPSCCRWPAMPYRVSTRGGRVTFCEQAELIEMARDAWLRSRVRPGQPPPAGAGTAIRALAEAHRRRPRNSRRNGNRGRRANCSSVRGTQSSARIPRMARVQSRGASEVRTRRSSRRARRPPAGRRS